MILVTCAHWLQLSLVDIYSNTSVQPRYVIWPRPAIQATNLFSHDPYPSLKSSVFPCFDDLLRCMLLSHTLSLSLSFSLFLPLFLPPSSSSMPFVRMHDIIRKGFFTLIRPNPIFVTYHALVPTPTYNLPTFSSEFSPPLHRSTLFLFRPSYLRLLGGLLLSLLEISSSVFLLTLHFGPFTQFFSFTYLPFQAPSTGLRIH